MFLCAQYHLLPPPPPRKQGLLEVGGEAPHVLLPQAAGARALWEFFKGSCSLWIGKEGTQVLLLCTTRFPCDLDEVLALFVAISLW